jgi:hypothetical protein
LQVLGSTGSVAGLINVFRGVPVSWRILSGSPESPWPESIDSGSLAMISK